MDDKKKILLVEDDALILKMLSEQLSHAGYEISMAQDGEEGINKTHELAPDLIILDLTLPKIDGIEVLAKIKADPVTSNIKIFILSNNNQDETIKRALKLGVDDYMIKVNFTPEEIVGKVDKVLKQ